MRNSFYIGKTDKRSKLMLALVIWLFISLIPSGFHYEEYAFMKFVAPILLFVTGILLTLPEYVSNYWAIHGEKILYMHTNSYIKKVMRFVRILFLNSDEKYAHTIAFKDIDTIEIIYLTETAAGPFKFPNPFYLQVDTVHKESVALDLTIVGAGEQLVDICTYLESKGITIIDPLHILEACKNNENIYEYVHQRNNVTTSK